MANVIIFTFYKRGWSGLVLIDFRRFDNGFFATLHG